MEKAVKQKAVKAAEQKLEAARRVLWLASTPTEVRMAHEEVLKAGEDFQKKRREFYKAK